MIIEKIKNLIDKHDVISFDIFDTLLLRVYAKPIDLFLHMEKLFNIPGFSNARIAAEENARMHSTNEEVCLDQIYKELPNYYQLYKDKEIELEVASIKANYELYQVYSYALDKKKKIIITSDMYLPKEILINILDKNGYNNYDHFYLSSEVLLTKRTGNLYEHILKDLVITNPNRILHIGDDYKSDFEKAIEKGLHAYHYTSALEQLFNSNIRTKMYYEQNPNNIGASILLGLLAYNYLKFQNNYWKDFGYNYAGPVVFSFVYWLKKSFEKDQIDNVLFVARDGYSLKKVFDLINNKEIKTNYIYAPRALSTLFFSDFDEKKYIDPKEKLLAIKLILSHYKERDEILKKETPDVNNVEEGSAFIRKHISIYKKLAKEEAKSYKNYIENLASDKRNAIIDTCSINLSSQRLIEQVTGKQLYGYYYLLQANENNNLNLDDYILRSYREDPFSWIKDWDLMEFFMTSPEAPIRYFTNGEPVYKIKDKYDVIRSEVYPIISDGILDFAKDLLSSFPNHDTFINWKNIFDWINIFCSTPTSYDKEKISCIKHAFDFSHQKYVPICKHWFDFEYQSNTYIKNKITFKDIVILKKIIKNKESIYYFLGIPILKLEKQYKNINLKVFRFISFYKRKERKGKMKYYIFNIPVLTIIKTL